ncbi:MAG: DUF4062 domain-containing protein [Flavobacteriaceae bacterium]|nr:DUF4062 domain-containing protein [Flavobacteriaceae bacterium]
MSKPRIFVSSTYYDLKFIRGTLETFINEYGFEPVLFEKGHVTYNNDFSIEYSSYKEVTKSDILIFVIGGSYGTKANKKNEIDFNTYNSISKEEYKVALENNIPTYTFILAEIVNEYEIFKLNRNKDITYSTTKTIEIFKLLDFIYGLNENNVVTPFNSIYDILNFLKVQWAGLFHEFLINKKEQLNINNIKNAINELKDIASRLEKYNEKIILQIDAKSAKELLQEKQELLQRKELEKSFNQFCDTTFGKFILKYFDFDNDQQWVDMIIKSENLISFLKACKVPQKQISYIVQNDSSENEFLNVKKIIEGFI